MSQARKEKGKKRCQERKGEERKGERKERKGVGTLFRLTPTNRLVNFSHHGTPSSRRFGRLRLPHAQPGQCPSADLPQGRRLRRLRTHPRLGPPTRGKNR